MDDGGIHLIEESAQTDLEGTGSLARRTVSSSRRSRRSKVTRWIKKHSKGIAIVLVSVIIVSIISAILVVIPIQHTGNRKPDLYSRPYTLGDTSLTEIDTTLCSHASIQLETGYQPNTEVALDIFEKEPELTFKDIMLVGHPGTEMDRGDSVAVMTAHIHPGSYADWSVCAVWKEGCKTKHGHILVFRSKSDHDRWYNPALSGDFDLAYWHENINDGVCAPCCGFQLNYTSESDYFHHIVNTADTNDIICNIEMNSSIVVHRKQYIFDPDRHYGCIANANSTSCKVSTDPGPHVVVSVTNVAGDDTARWNETVQVSLHCSPKHGTYAAIGVVVCLVVFVTVGKLFILGFCIYRFKTRGTRKKKKPLDLRRRETLETVIPTSNVTSGNERVGQGATEMTETSNGGEAEELAIVQSTKPESGRAPEDVRARRVWERTSVTSNTSDVIGRARVRDDTVEMAAVATESTEVLVQSTKTESGRAPEEVGARRVGERTSVASNSSDVVERECLDLDDKSVKFPSRAPD